MHLLLRQCALRTVVLRKATVRYIRAQPAHPSRTYAMSHGPPSSSPLPQPHTCAHSTTSAVLGTSNDSHCNALRDLLMYGLQVLGWYLFNGRTVQAPDSSDSLDLNEQRARQFLVQALHSSLPNVNNDPVAIISRLAHCEGHVVWAQGRYLAACAAANAQPTELPGPGLPQATQICPSRLEELVQRGQLVPMMAEHCPGGVGAAACEMLLAGVKGLSAHADHCAVAGVEDETTMEFLEEALAFVLVDGGRSERRAWELCLRLGQVNLHQMSALEAANARLGEPEPTDVTADTVPGKCVLVSGHDLHVLASLLKATEGLEINVYTHGDMLPAHAYPDLRRHGHLVGHFGGSWSCQSGAFADFPGPIVMTGGCFVDPRPEYAARAFTFGAVGWPGVTHLGDELEEVDWLHVVNTAYQCPGFARATAPGPSAEAPAQPCPAAPGHRVGYGHEALVRHAPAIAEAIRTEEVKRLYVIGGCDGPGMEAAHLRKLALALPETALLMTLGCTKYYVAHLPAMYSGTVGDTAVPRVLDVGQCHNAHTALTVAHALAQAMHCALGDLPLSFAVPGLHAKSAPLVLSLLYLGVRPVYLGAPLPPFMTPALLELIQREYGVVYLGEGA